MYCINTYLSDLWVLLQDFDQQRRCAAHIHWLKYSPGLECAWLSSWPAWRMDGRMNGKAVLMIADSTQKN